MKEELPKFAARLQTRATNIRNMTTQQFHCYNKNGDGLPNGQKKWFKQAMRNADELDKAAAALLTCFNRIID